MNNIASKSISFGLLIFEYYTKSTWFIKKRESNQQNTCIFHKHCMNISIPQSR